MNDPISTSPGRWVQFACGALGASIQDIILFFSKRFSAPLLEFNIAQYAVVLLVYCAAAGAVASIFPYRAPQTRWKAFVVGLLLPTLIAGLIAAAQRVEGGRLDVTLRGPPPSTETSQPQPTIYGDLVDLLALF